MSEVSPLSSCKYNAESTQHEPWKNPMTKRYFQIFVIVVVLIGASRTWLRAQQAQFQVSVDLVQLNVAVTDSKGKAMSVQETRELRRLILDLRLQFRNLLAALQAPDGPAASPAPAALAK